MTADQGQVHHVEVFPCDGDWGWQCFTCGAQRFGLPSCEKAVDDSDEHEGACRCESH